MLDDLFAAVFAILMIKMLLLLRSHKVRLQRL